MGAGRLTAGRRFGWRGSCLRRRCPRPIPAGALRGCGGRRHRLRRFAVPAGGWWNFPGTGGYRVLWQVIPAGGWRHLTGTGCRSLPGRLILAKRRRCFVGAGDGPVSAGTMVLGPFLRRRPAPLDRRPGGGRASSLGSARHRGIALPLALAVECGFAVCPMDRILGRRRIFPRQRSRPVLRSFSLPGSSIGPLVVQRQPGGWGRWRFCRSSRRWLRTAALDPRSRLTAPLRTLGWCRPLWGGRGGRLTDRPCRTLRRGGNRRLGPGGIIAPPGGGLAGIAPGFWRRAGPGRRTRPGGASRRSAFSGGSALSAFALTVHSGGYRSAHSPHCRHGDHQRDATAKGGPSPGRIQPDAADQIIHLPGHPGDSHHKQ